MPPLDDFLSEQKAARASAQSQLKALASERNINLNGVQALTIDYDTAELADAAPLQTLAQLHRRQKRALNDAYDVSHDRADHLRAQRRTPLRPI